MNKVRRFGVAMAAALLVALSIGPGIALAADVQHGIGLTKGCTSPVKIGDPYACSYTIRNVLDEAEDTLTINGLVDVVHAASGDVNSGNILGSVQITTVNPVTGLPSGATCAAAGGNGSVATPYTGVTSCTLPFGSRVNVLSFSHYTVQAGDFALLLHVLRDDASLAWHDLCNDPAGTGNSNCNPNPPNVSAGSQALIQQLTSSTATDIHNAAHAVVTAVAVGTNVHDFVTVTGQPGQPVPTGNVNIDWFLNGDCSGAPAVNSGSVGPLSAAGTFDATAFNFTVNAPGFRAFRAHYEGDARYTGSDGACEPLRVVDANIQITPNGTNRVGQNHTFTAHANVNDGTGFVNAPDGTVITFTTVDANGATSAPNPPTSCVTAGGTGSCQTTISSPTTGTSTVSAHTTVSVAGVSLTRHTDGAGANSGPAVKTWVNARISITPDAFNEVGQGHTFIVTLQKDAGNGAGFVPAAGEHVDFTLTDSAGASHSAPTGTCTGAGANTNASGQCTISFTSLTPGTVVGHATSTLSVAGSAAFTVNTDGTGGSSGDATKVFQDANIQITPNGTNRVGAPHTFTAHVNANLGGGGGFQNAPDGTVITFTSVDALGATSTPNPPTSCVTTGGTGSCTTTITSPTTGTTTVSAHTTFTTPQGVVLTRNTDGVGLNSGPAVKTWVNARITIAPDATNEVGAPHTFTVTLSKDLGNGAGFVAAAGETVTVTLTPSNGAAATPAGPFTGTTNGAGQFQATFTSNSAGQVTGHASSTLTVNGSAPFSVATDGVGPNSGDAVKTFVDANIQITPNGTNRVGQNHTFTAHVNVNTGTGGFVNAPDGTVITFTTVDTLGATSTPNPPTSCVTAGGTGSCTTTITSPTTGVSTVSAHTVVSVGGVSLTRHTDGTGANSGPAVKTWVNAKISITPNAFNEVTHPHTFFVKVEKDPGTGTFVPAAGEHVDFTLSNTFGANAVLDAGASTCDDAGPNTNAAGECTITFASSTAGTVSGHATTTLSVGGSAAFTISTDGTGGNSGDATKVFQDANIQITPNGANRVGQTHIFTAHVNANLGDGLGFQNAPDGTVITFTSVDANGATSTPAPPTSCLTAGGTGSCTTTITSPTTGTTTVTAHTTFTTPQGVVLTRSTNGVGANSVPAVKTWVNAKIEIHPDATNEVGQPHTFTVTLLKDTGDGNDFVAAPGEHVDVTLVGSNGAIAILDAPNSTCDDAGANTDAAGQCTIKFTSNSAGKVTGHATSTLSVNGSAAFTVATDGVAPNSGDAVKTFVDANIQITPATATNPISTNHVLTGHVNVNTGTGGFQNAPNGTVISFTLVNAGGATASFVGPSTCTVTNGLGSCTVTISSSTVGSTTVKAITDVSVGGVSLHRETGDGKVGDSVDANKSWVNASITIAPNATNEVGAPHTFTVTLLKDNAGTIVPAAGEHVTVTLTDSNGAAHTAPTGTCTNAGPNTDVNGQCTITFTSNSAGKVTGHASSTLSVNGSAPFTVETNGVAPNSGDAVKTFVDANLQITPNGTNRVGASHTFTAHVNVNAGLGFVNAPDGTVITFTSVDANGAVSTPAPPTSCVTAGGTGSCTTTISSPSTGTTTVTAHTTVSVGGVSLTRHTNGTGANSGPAVKTWVNAKIEIHPDATNEVGQPHTFTVTLSRDLGDGAGFVAFPGAHVDFTLTNSNGASSTLNAASSTCDDAGANTNAAGQCTIVFTSNAAGQVTGNASWTGSLGTPSPFTVSTNGVAPNSGPAVKTFVDANIQITPQTANNPVSTNHTLTGHVNINAGGGAGYVPAPAGTTITFSLVNSGGATASFVGPNSCTTVAATGSCTVVISSSTTGSTTIKATTTVVVGGVSLTRTTADGKLGDSADANKTWSDAVVTTRVLDASNTDITNTTVPAGTVVHDEATVAKAAGTPAAAPAPSGTVSFTLYNNGTCNGAVVATDPNKPLSGGVATSVTFTTPVAGGTFSYLAHYNGDANYPARNGPCEPFTVRTVPVGQITPTQVDCADFVAGAPTLAQINYTTSGGKIGQNINPGVFFFWTTITTTVPNQVVTVSQTNTSTNNAALFTVHQGWDRLYLGNCSSYKTGTEIAGGSGASFTVATPGTYHIGIKYSTKSIAGTIAPVPSDITYNFATSLGGQTGASVLLKKQ